ncbi:MAG: GNAT family N-acetyltransferase [Oscillospiraceae bacterium]|nr:GNAT family N-acetyltransferase [Oscillospiraceae bacterium]
MGLTIGLAYDRLDEVKLLFGEYVAMLGVSLDFQNYEDELARLPGDYSLPNGRLYLADCDGQLAGCIALKPYDSSTCEVKRLFVRPEFRGKRVGRALMETVIDNAREIGYSTVLLDTMGFLADSVVLYKKLGFTETEPYRYNPLSDAMFFKLEL